MDLFFPCVSDESLFIQMTKGNKQSQEILFRRYEHKGRQIAGAIIRQKRLLNYTDQDFYEDIIYAILKAFRYYVVNACRFSEFCTNTLKSHIARAIVTKQQEDARLGELFSLDSPIRDDSTLTFHEVVGDDGQLSSGDYYDANTFLNNVYFSSSTKKRMVARIYILRSMGYTLNEISKKTHRTIYEIREVLKNFEKFIIGLDIDITIR